MKFNLTFCGVPFCSDTADPARPTTQTAGFDARITRQLAKAQPEPDLLDEINRVLPKEYLREFTLPGSFPGRNLSSLARQTADDRQPSDGVRVGDWYYPTGATRWGVFRGLATTSQKEAMEAASDRGRGPFSMLASPNDAPTAGYQIDTYLYLLPPRPLQELGGQYDGLYLVTLVDERFYFQGTPVSLHVDATSTWDSLLAQVATALGITLNYSAIDPVYGTPEPDSQLWTNFENAATMLETLALNVGRVVVRNMGGTYSLLTYAESQVQVQTNRNLNLIGRVGGGDLLASGNLPRVGTLTDPRNTVVPTSYTVTFPGYSTEDWQNFRRTTIWGVPHYINRGLPYHPSAWFEDGYGYAWSVNVPIASGGPMVSGLAGQSTQTLQTTARAYFRDDASLFSGTPYDPWNGSGLRAYAMQLARDRYEAQVAAALDEVYPGTLAWTPEGIHDVVWTYSARSRLASTRVLRAAWTDSVTSFQHAGPLYSGAVAARRGVGGHTVAQTIRDECANFLLGTPISGNYPISGVLWAPLAHSLVSGWPWVTVPLSGYSTGQFPTNNRWRAQIDDEILLLDGAGQNINIVARGIDGTAQADHLSGAIVQQIIPDTTYGVNLTTYRGMYAYPMEYTSGGLTGVRIESPVRTLYVTSIAQGANGLPAGDWTGFLSGQTTVGTARVVEYDYAAGEWASPSGAPTGYVIERNNFPLNSGDYVDGQFVGYMSGNPLYMTSVPNVCYGILNTGGAWWEVELGGTLGPGGGWKIRSGGRFGTNTFSPAADINSYLPANAVSGTIVKLTRFAPAGVEDQWLYQSPSRRLSTSGNSFYVYRPVCQSGVLDVYSQRWYLAYDSLGNFNLNADAEVFTYTAGCCDCPTGGMALPMPLFSLPQATRENEAPAEEVKIPPLPECPHRGTVTDELVPCATCPAGVKLRVFRCDKHPEGCTVGKQGVGKHLCDGDCGGVEVPPPPPLNLAPTKLRAVAVVAAGKEGRDLFALSRPWLSAYAKRLDADLVVLDWEVPEHGIYSKFQLGRVLDFYERVCFLDGDTLADPYLAPDLFALVPEGEFGIYDDFPGLQANGAMAVFGEEYQAVRLSQGWERKELSFYGNTGVMVFDRSHRKVFDLPAKPLPKLHCGEQHYWVARMDDLGVKVRTLPRGCNYQWWENDKFEQEPPPGAILHYSGMRPHRSNADRLEVMAWKAFWKAAGMLQILGVGLPRTGTHSLALSLSGALRAAHEPDVERLQLALLGEADVKEVLRATQRKHFLQAAVSNLYGHCLPELLELFPEAKVVLTVREPVSWLRSILNWRATPYSLTPLWREVDERLRGGERGPVAWLAYWERHHRAVLDLVPGDRLFILRTDRMAEGMGGLATFCGVGELEARHEYRGYYEADVLSQWTEDHLQGLTDAVCPTWKELEGR